jgi:hypothetical protein
MPNYPFLEKTNYIEREVAVNQVNAQLADGGRTLDVFQEEGHFRIFAERCFMIDMHKLAIETSKPILKRKGKKWREAPPEIKYGRLGRGIKAKVICAPDAKVLFTVLWSPWKEGVVRYAAYNPDYDPDAEGCRILRWEGDSPVLG